MRSALAALDRCLERTGGILPLRPNLVRRFYRAGGRLGFPVRRTDGRFRPERWIASTVRAASPSPTSREGLSEVSLPGATLTLEHALSARREVLLGRGPREFAVLVKILDALEPIAFHFHATDAQVRRMPHRFPGQRLGKDEAYYFLDAPKATCPYTHVGLHSGVTRRDLERALARGRDAALELSPSFFQRTGEGFFTPAGVPHRPGSALTLEIQEPSDVYTLLETESNGRALAPEEIHPGFASLPEALALIDFRLATRKDLLERNRLVPEPIRRGRGFEEARIFPPRLTRKFSGSRIRLAPGRTIECREPGPYALFVWRGEGLIEGVPLAARPGRDEVFVGAVAATRPHHLRGTGSLGLEAFVLQPVLP